MAKITFGKEKQFVLEISPLTIWSNPGSEGEFMEYQLGLFCEGKSIFNPELSNVITIVKGEEDEYLADFIFHAVSSQQGENWTPLEPKTSLYMQPVNQLMCCGANAVKAPFLLDISLDQNLFAGEGKVFGSYSNTGLSIRFEAPAQEWITFSNELHQEECDFEEEPEDNLAAESENPISGQTDFDEEIEITRPRRK